MLNKSAGLSLSLLSTVICSIFFQSLIRGEKDIQVILGGGFLIMFYASPFILVGTISSLLIDKFFDKLKILWYICLGFVISLIIILLFGFYRYIDVAIFVILTSIVGAIVFLLGSSIKGRIIKYFISLGIPLFLFLLMYIL